jgi:hypothetical protein
MTNHASPVYVMIGSERSTGRVWKVVQGLLWRLLGTTTYGYCLCTVYFGDLLQFHNITTFGLLVSDNAKAHHVYLHRSRSTEIHRIGNTKVRLTRNEKLIYFFTHFLQLIN